MLVCPMRIKAIVSSHFYSKVVGLVGVQLKLLHFNTKGGKLCKTIHRFIMRWLYIHVELELEIIHVDSAFSLTILVNCP